MEIGFFSLTSCEGCLFALLDLKEKFFALNKKVRIKSFRLLEEGIHMSEEKFDIAFVEGSPLTEQNIEQLKKVRKQAKTLIAIGSCAHIGGIYHLKQYSDKEKIFNYVYSGNVGVENFDVLPVNKIVKVDYFLPGCPVNANEFLQFIHGLIIGKSPSIEQNPVCRECQIRGYECVLQKGEICLGPITQAGCDAVCLKSKQGCWGCRGLAEDAQIENLVKELRKKHTDHEIIKVLEVFGIKDLLN